MLQYKNLYLIGTSHIAKQSLDDVKKAFIDINPDIIAIELDFKRLQALKLREKGHKQDRFSFTLLRRVGLKGYIFSLIGAWAEEKLGDFVGVKPGSEMLLAAKLADKNSKPLALIDQDIEITLKQLSSSITWREKFNFVIDILRSVIFRKPEVMFDLSKVPSESIVNFLIEKTKKRYPTIYSVLIMRRNRIMAKNLTQIIIENPEKKVVAFIGAGHEKAILSLVKDFEEKYHSNKITFTYSVTK